jgi:predicted ATP-dependent serine protease
LIGADTGVGKSTFVNQVVKNLSSAGTRVARYSLEDRMEDIGKEDIYYMTNQYRVKK